MTLWKYQNRRKFDRATGRTVVALHRISIVRFVTLQSNACNRPRAAGRCAIQFQLVKRHQAKLSDRYSASKLEPSLPQAGQNSPLLSFLHFGLSFCPNTPKRPLNWWSTVTRLLAPMKKLMRISQQNIRQRLPQFAPPSPDRIRLADMSRCGHDRARRLGSRRRIRQWHVATDSIHRH